LPVNSELNVIARTVIGKRFDSRLYYSTEKAITQSGNVDLALAFIFASFPDKDAYQMYEQFKPTILSKVAALDLTNSEKGSEDLLLLPLFNLNDKDLWTYIDQSVFLQSRAEFLPRPNSDFFLYYITTNQYNIASLSTPNDSPSKLIYLLRKQFDDKHNKLTPSKEVLALQNEVERKPISSNADLATKILALDRSYNWRYYYTGSIEAYGIKLASAILINCLTLALVVFTWRRGIRR
jgi:hypothetical protein